MKTIRNTKRRTPERRPSTQDKSADLNALKESLLEERLASGAPAALKAQYRWAADEAAALAFVTPWPSLFFPVLCAEKADAAQEQVARQERIRERTFRARVVSTGADA